LQRIAGERRWRSRGSLPAAFERGELTRAPRPRKGHGGSEGKRDDTLSARAGGSFARVGIGSSKGCARASWSWLQKSVGGLRLREARADPSPEGSVCVDGGLASSRERARKRHAAGSREERPSAGSSRKASRDRTETVTIRARVRMSPADGRHFGSRSSLLVTECEQGDLGSLWKRRPRESMAAWPEEATRVPEVRFAGSAGTTTPCVNPSEPTEAGRAA